MKEDKTSRGTAAFLIAMESVPRSCLSSAGKHGLWPNFAESADCRSQQRPAIAPQTAVDQGRNYRFTNNLARWRREAGAWASARAERDRLATHLHPHSPTWDLLGNCRQRDAAGSRPIAAQASKINLTRPRMRLILARSSKPCWQIGRLLKPTMASPSGAGRCVSGFDEWLLRADRSTEAGNVARGYGDWVSALSRAFASLAVIGTTSCGYRCAYSRGPELFWGGRPRNRGAVTTCWQGIRSCARRGETSVFGILVSLGNVRGSIARPQRSTRRASEFEIPAPVLRILSAHVTEHRVRSLWRAPMSGSARKLDVKRLLARLC